MSFIQQTVLPMDVSILQQTVLDAFNLQQTVLPLDVSILQHTVLWPYLLYSRLCYP